MTLAVRATPALAWTREGDLLDVAGGRVRWRAWAEPVLDAVRAGSTLADLDLVARKALPDESEARASLLLRHLLFTLLHEGLVLVPVEAPSTLAGRFAVERELGRGGIGVAFLARDAVTGERVVAKRAWPFYGPMDKVEPTLRAEALLLETLESPRIVRRVAAFEEAGVFWLVRGYAAGAPLESLADGVADAARRVAIVRSLAACIADVHARGHLLVSVRPAHFHVDGAAATLVDVGHARPMTEGVVRLARRHGTPGWTAPEIASTRTATPATDVWGLARLAEFLVADAEATPGERALIDRAGATDPDARPPTVADAIRLL